MMLELKNKGINIGVSIVYSVALIFFILTFSISLPIYFRPFYYFHIEPLKLVERSGFSADEIREAYDLMMDYLTLPGKEFSTGVMRFSDEGAAHFDDCKWLFSLNAIVLIIAVLILVCLFVMRKLKIVQQFRLGRHSASFYSGLAAVLMPIVIGGLASINFTEFFTFFHYVFFPGKTNWMFNPYTDEIIKVLPENFFMNCAILIGVSILIMSLSLIIFDVVKNRKARVKSERKKV